MVGLFFQTRKCVVGSMVRSRQDLDFQNYYRGLVASEVNVFKYFGKMPMANREISRGGDLEIVPIGPIP